METEKNKLIHTGAIGSYIELDGIRYRIVYRDSYLDETVTVIDELGSDVGHLTVVCDDNSRTYRKYTKSSKKTYEYTVPTDDIFALGEDVLGSSIGHPEFEKVRSMLPPYDDDAYIALGHPASERSATVDRRGRIFRQRISYEELRALFDGEIAYDPADEFGELGAVKPYQSFLDGKYPILFNVHENDSQILESLYILETGNYRHGGAVYVRNAVIDKESGELVRCDYRIVGTDCYSKYNAVDAVLSPELFYDCMLSTVGYFEDFEKNNSSVVLPIKELERTYIGTMFTVEGLFSAERMRYGHRIYGCTYHDFFPPTFITALLAYSLNGQTLKAGRLAQYLLANVVDKRGRILYRQGDSQNYGFSASELGQFLWILSRYEGIMEPHGCLRPYYGKILAMGNFLISKICEADEIPGVSVIRTCAEADTNERVHDYLENTLWGIRGLEAICRMSDVLSVDTDVYREAADRLRSDIKCICRITEIDSPFGKLVPFRLGYTALPLTLSSCRDTAYPISDEEFAKYRIRSDMRSDAAAGITQDITENCYANYRYYPEMLSSSLLDRKYEDSIIRMREKLGGELLCMSRWNCGADDWPAYNLAISYMERHDTEKFLKLLYSHTCHHGLVDFHIYYEQFKISDGLLHTVADTAVPSILLTNLMINMMFCYESVDSSQIELLKAVPPEWLNGEEISIDNVYTSRGKLSVMVADNTVRLSFGSDFGEVRLWLNGFDKVRLEQIACLNDGVRCDGDSLIIEGAVGEKLIILS